MPASLPILELGLVPYADALQRMRGLAERVARDAAAGEVWLLEHPPVFTAGRAISAEEVARQEGPIPTEAIERGGRMTFHGPGQLVVYPIVQLPQRDVRRWLRGLEQFGMAVCAAFGLDADPSVDGTGVFVGQHKVASIGVAIRRWVNLHGIAINIDMDLQPFHRIQPCGLNPDVMSDLSREVGHQVPLTDAIAAARQALPDLLDL